MKYIFRAFFKTVRFIVGPILLLGERLNTSKGVVRTPEAQQIVDRKCKALAL